MVRVRRLVGVVVEGLEAAVAVAVAAAAAPVAAAPVAAAPVAVAVLVAAVKRSGLRQWVRGLASPHVLQVCRRVAVCMSAGNCV